MDNLLTLIRIILIDDDPDSVARLSDLLKQSDLSCTFDWYNTLSFDVDVVSKETYDLCLVDYYLDEQTGIDRMREVREALGCRVPTIVLTAHDDWDVELASMKDGADGYLATEELDARSLERGVRWAVEPRRGADSRVPYRWPVFNTRRDKSFIVDVSTEVSRRKEAEAALHESEERLRIALKNSSVIAFAQDLDLRYTWIYTPSEALDGSIVRGKRDSDILPGELADRIRTIKQSVIATGTGARQEIAVPWIGGDLVFDCTFEPLRSVEGEIVGITGSAMNITDIRQVEKELYLFKNLVDHSDDLILMIESESGRILDMNSTACTTLGYSREELVSMNVAQIGGTITDAGGWADYVKSIENVDQKLRQGQGLRKDGTTFPIETNAKLVTVDGHRYVVAINRDISARVEAEELLEKSRKLSQAILHSLAAHICVVDPNGSIVAINQAWEDFGAANGSTGTSGTGVGANYLYACRKAAAQLSQDAQNALDGIQAVLNGSATEFRMEYACHSPTCKRWFLLSATSLPDNLGAVISHTDLTERKIAEDALGASKKLFQTFMDNSPTISFIKDSRNRYLFTNKEFAGLFNMTPDELQGNTARDLFTQDVVEELERVNHTVVGNLQILQGIEHVPTTAVERYWFVVRFPVIDHDGSILMGVNGVEITQQMLAEKELHEANDSLEARVVERTAELHAALIAIEEAHIRQKQFVADASHDMRTPMTIVRGELELLLDDDDVATQTTASLRRAVSGIDRLDALCSDLLMMASLDSGEVCNRIDMIRLDELLLGAISALAQMSHSTNVTWNVNIADPVEIECDRALVERAIINVLENSVKYSTPGSVVDVSLVTTEREVLITVIDSGQGIAADDLARVFDRFYRSDRARSSKGTGLGLSIARMIIESQNGSISITSQLGIGTEVSIALPRSGS